MKSLSIINQILNIVRNIEKDINSENRDDRLKLLERENQLLKGNLERTDERVRALEKYLKVEYVRSSDYKLVKNQ